MKFKALTLACCASAVFWSPAQAAVTVGDYTLDEGSFGTGYGVHSTGTQQGNTLDAIVNNDGSAVTFGSTDVLTMTGNGEATVYPLTDLITNLTVHFEKAWDYITFSFAGDTGTFDLLVNGIAAFTSGGNCSICEIGNGQNKFTLNGTGITDLAFTFDPGVDTAKQFRVEGLSNVPAVPEPATWAIMLLGFAFVGSALRSRRRKEPRVRFAF